MSTATLSTLANVFEDVPAEITATVNVVPLNSSQAMFEIKRRDGRLLSIHSSANTLLEFDTDGTVIAQYGNVRDAHTFSLILQEFLAPN